MNGHAETIEADGHGLPRIRVFWSNLSTPSMAVNVQFTTGHGLSETWLSLRQARELALHLQAFAYVVEAMITENVA